MKPKKDKFRLSMINWITVIIMSSSGAIAAYLYLKSNNEENTKNTDQPEVTNPSATKDKPAIYSANIKRITEECKKIVSTQNSFTVFEHGTCVRILEPIDDPKESAISSLEILGNPSMTFVVKTLNNNDYLIVFNDYLFCWLFAKDIALIKQSLLTDTRLSLSLDDPKSIRDLPDFERRLGKLARLLLLKDAESKKVVLILKSKEAK